MAEIVVFVIDKEKTGDPAIDCHRYMAGDVVDMFEDGAVQWEKTAVVGDPRFEIVKLPGIPLRLLTQLTASELGYSDREALKVNRAIRRRAHTLNIVELRAELRKGPAVPLNKILPLLSTKPKLVDPLIIGSPKGTSMMVIGEE